MTVSLNTLLHMHQPDYRPAHGGPSLLPWVRLHACKGYLDIADFLERAAHFRCCVNFSGILLEQLQEHAARYVHGELAPDTWAALCLVPPGTWTSEQRDFAVYNFFSANLDRMITPHLRYRELYDKRLAGLDGKLPSDSMALAKAASTFTEQDLLDLAVCFNLSWLGFAARRNDLADTLLDKHGGYSMEDLTALLRLHGRVVQGVLERYRELAAAGRIELSFTPYQHALLPLLCDLSALGHDDVLDPLPDFKFPADAKEHVQRGIAAFQAAFQQAPQGAWPAEGSVSDAALEILAGAGLSWFMTDQANLPQLEDKSLAHVDPWLWQHGEFKITAFFRDTRLSDNIGFEYARWMTSDAAAHFVENVVALGLKSNSAGPVVTIVLDGENPWENYPGGGEDFLLALDNAIGEAEDLKCELPAELCRRTGLPPLAHVRGGSWIGGNFNIWTRHQATRKAWRLLAEARTRLAPNMDNPEVKRHLLAAEASDWFWWYGDDFASDNKDIFDALFKGRLEAAYAAAGIDVSVLH